MTQIRNLGNLLVDFHGQHEHQLLLHARSHIGFLDGFDHLYGFTARLADRRKALADLTRRVRDLEQEIADITSKEDFIRYEIQEIGKPDLRDVIEDLL